MNYFTRYLHLRHLALSAAFTAALASASGGAQAANVSDLSHAVSMIPVASVLIAGSVIHDAATASGKASADLANGSAALVVKSVTASADGTVYVLERLSDGVRFTVNASAKVGGTASTLVGTAVTASATGAGVLLSVAGEVLAFIPNTLGRALMHHEQVSR